MSGVDMLHTLAGELEELKDGTVPRDTTGVQPSAGVREWAKGWLISLTLVGADPKRGQL